MATLSDIDEMKRVARGYHPPLTPQQQFDQQRALRKQSNAGSAAHQLMDLQASKAAGSSPTGQPPAGSTYYGKPREGSTGIIAEGVTEGANKAPDTLRGRPRPGGTTAGTTGGTAAAPGGSTSSPVEAAATVDPATGETTTESESGFTQVSGILGEVAPGQTIESPGIYQPQPYEASQDELVAGQLSRLLGENSPYLQQARTQAQQAAHARGLGNTAMAAGWGQEAAIKSALPIAQQDAGYYQERGLEDQKGIISSHLQKQKGDIDKDLLVTDIASQEKQQQVGIAANKALQAQQDAAYMERLQVEISARSDLQAEQNAAEALRQQVEIAAQQKLAELEFDQETQVQLTDSLGTLSQQFQRETAEILTNPDFKTAADRNKALQSSAQAYQDSVNLMASLAGVEVTWPTNFTTNTQTTSSTGTTAKTGTTTTGTGTTTTKAPTMTEAQIKQLNRSHTLTKDSVPPDGYKLVYHRSGLSRYYTFEPISGLSI